MELFSFTVKILTSKRIFFRSGHGTPNHLPKNQRKQFKARQQNTSNNHNNATSGNNGASNAPEEEKAQPFKRIVAINLPAKYQNVEALTSVFHPYGDVNIVRVLKVSPVLSLPHFKN